MNKPNIKQDKRDKDYCMNASLIDEEWGLWNIRLKNAKTCDGCRASEARNECSLGYQCTDWKPLEPCPKPKTIRQLIDSGKKTTP